MDFLSLKIENFRKRHVLEGLPREGDLDAGGCRAEDYRNEARGEDARVPQPLSTQGDPDMPTPLTASSSEHHSEL